MSSSKSTLLRLMAGRNAPDNGTVTVVAPGGVGYLPQSLDLPENAIVQDAVDRSLTELRELERQLRAAEAELTDRRRSDEELAKQLAAYAELMERYHGRGGYEADSRVDIMLHHVGLPDL